VNVDGTPNSAAFDHVSQWSLDSMTPFFLENGVVLKPLYAYAIDDRPVWAKDQVTEEYVRNTGQVI
jgi:hypothetical protein